MNRDRAGRMVLASAAVIASLVGLHDEGWADNNYGIVRPSLALRVDQSTFIITPGRYHVGEPRLIEDVSESGSVRHTASDFRVVRPTGNMQISFGKLKHMALLKFPAGKQSVACTGAGASGYFTKPSERHHVESLVRFGKNECGIKAYVQRRGAPHVLDLGLPTRPVLFAGLSNEFAQVAVDAEVNLEPWALLRNIGLSRDDRGIFSSFRGALGFTDSLAGGVEGGAQEPNRPTADADSDKAGECHQPLRNPVLAANVGLYESGQPGGFLLRFVVFLGLSFVIMPAAARFSGRDWGRNPYRFYGGLIGGMALWFLSGAAIFAFT